jgi:hypothetical protein
MNRRHFITTLPALVVAPSMPSSALPKPKGKWTFERDGNGVEFVVLWQLVEGGLYCPVNAYRTCLPFEMKKP